MKYIYIVILIFFIGGCSSKIVEKERPNDLIRSNWYILFADKDANNYYFWKKDGDVLFKYEPYKSRIYIEGDKNSTIDDYKISIVNKKDLEELNKRVEKLKENRKIQIKYRDKGTSLLIVKRKFNFLNRYIFKQSKELKDFEMFVSQFRFREYD